MASVDDDNGRNSARAGNIMFLILIAVALFAALSYVVTSSSRSGAKNSGTEAASLHASRLLQYATSLDAGIERMRIRGVPDGQFDLYSPRVPANANGNCLSAKCRLFDQGGGGAIWQNVANNDVVGQAYYAAGVRNIGTTLPDLVLFVGYVPDEVCRIINYKMGVAASLGTSPPNDSHSGATHYSGTLSAFPSASKIFGNAPNTQFAGKRDFCYKHATWGRVYIHVLLPR